MQVSTAVLRNAGRNNAKMLGRCSVPSSFFRFQIGDSGKNGRTSSSGMAGKQSGNCRIPPSLVSAANGRQMLRKCDGNVICGAYQQAASGREALRVAEHSFSLIAVGKQFREPRRGGDKLNRNSHESAAPEQ